MPAARVKKLELPPEVEKAVMLYLQKEYINTYPNPTNIITGYYRRRLDEYWVIVQVGRWADPLGNIVPVFDKIKDVQWAPYLETNRDSHC